MPKATFSIDGMSCGACVRGVTNVLKKVEGVEVGQVSIGSAEVAFDPARTTPAAIAGALAAAGYPAREAQARRGLPVTGVEGGGCCCG